MIIFVYSCSLNPLHSITTFIVTKFIIQSHQTQYQRCISMPKPAKSEKRRSNNAAYTSSTDVLCATAGADNWQTWAGRSHGTAQFELLDILRGVKRKFNQKFVWGIPPAGTSCPVCMTVPDSKEDWHVTSACGHAVCRDCLYGYASSLVRDREHQGPLKCPVCPLPLRPKDAILALNHDPELIQLWDAKILDSLLRALPGYRHCPHCSGTSSPTANNDSNSNNESPARQSIGDAAEVKSTTEYNTSLMGGGFVTPECLAPIHEERETAAIAWIRHPLASEKFYVGLYIAYVYFYCGAIPSTSIYVDLIYITLLPLFWVCRCWQLGRRLASSQARRALDQPITVECPCCDQAFVLNAASELGSTVAADKATEAWIGNNTRRCPSCSVPISKIDGCNHMTCTHCRAQFCWACMRVGSSCRAFNCRNGAPYGNAGMEDNDQQLQDVGGMLDRIQRMEESSPAWDRRSDGLFVGSMVLSFVVRENVVVQWMAKALVKSFACLFTGGTMLSFIMAFVVSGYIRTGRYGIGDFTNGNAVRGVAEDLFDVDSALERRMVQDAIQRSLVEQ